MNWTVLGIFSLISLVIGYLFFGVLAPLLTSLIPLSSWKPLLDFAVYAMIAWGGGIGIPIVIFITGIYVSLIK